MLAILQNYEWLSVMPYHTGPLGGYRLLVSDFDIEDAVALLRERKVDGDAEELEIGATFSDRLSSLVFGLLAGGAPMPFRTCRWRQVA